MTLASITSKYGFAGLAELFGRFRPARKRVELEWKQTGRDSAAQIETIPRALPVDCALDYSEMPLHCNAHVAL